MRPKTYARIAAAIFAAEAAFAVIHRALGYVYPSFTPLDAVVIDVSLIILWAFALFSVLVPNKTSLHGAVFGAYLSLQHGLLMCIGARQPEGVPFVLAAGVLAFCISRGASSFGWRGLSGESAPPLGAAGRTTHPT